MWLLVLFCFPRRSPTDTSSGATMRSHCLVPHGDDPPSARQAQDKCGESVKSVQGGACRAHFGQLEGQNYSYYGRDSLRTAATNVSTTGIADIAV